MESSDRRASSSSTSNRPTATAKDENDPSYQEMGLSLKHQKKSTTTTTTKNFMSPTISAASKANLQRKNVLGERNVFSDTQYLHHHHQKTPSFDSRNTELSDNEKNSLVDDDGTLSSKPYDPLTNYLSPRPKFLRYKPNRRREILLRRENEVQEGKDGVSVSSESEEGELYYQGGGSSLHFEVGNEKEESEEIDETDEEVEEEGRWGFGGLVKFLVLFLVLLLSTSCISSMNSPAPSLVGEAVLVIKDGYHMIQGYVNGFLKTIDAGGYVLGGRAPKKMAFSDVEGVNEEVIQSYALQEIEQIQSGQKVHVNGIVKTIEPGGYVLRGRAPTEKAFSDIGVNEEEIQSYDSEEVEETQSGESEVSEAVEDEGRGEQDKFGEVGKVGESEIKEMAEHEQKGETDQLGDVVELKDEERRDISELGTEKTGEVVSDKVGMNSEVLETEAEVSNTQPMIDEVPYYDMDSKAAEVSETQSTIAEHPYHNMILSFADSFEKEETGVQGEDSKDVIELQIEKTTEDIAAEVEGNSELQEEEVGEVSETQSMMDEDHDWNIVSEGPDRAEKENEVEVQDADGQDVIELQMEKTGEYVSTEVEGNPEVQEAEAEELFEEENWVASESFKEKVVNSEIDGIGYVSDDYEIINENTEENSKEGLMKLMNNVSTYKDGIGISIFSLVMASLALGFRFKRKRNVRSYTSLVAQPFVEPVIAEKCSSAIANEEDKQTDLLVSVGNSKPLIDSLEKDSKKNYQSLGPSVELLGELVVGEMSRGRGIRSTSIESEVSSHYVSLKKVMGDKGHSVPVHVQQAFSMEKGTGNKVHSVHVQAAFSENSTTNFPSYGIFTSGKKIVKNQEGGNREARKETVTPVRRSSRIRNRTVVSP